jgi:hypothetical protein
VPPKRLPATKANQETYAPAEVLMPATYHDRGTGSRFIYIPQGAAADAAAASLLESIKEVLDGLISGLVESVPHVPLY